MLSRKYLKDSANATLLWCKHWHETYTYRHKVQMLKKWNRTRQSHVWPDCTTARIGHANSWFVTQCHWTANISILHISIWTHGQQQSSVPAPHLDL
jgi:hypothetical protein